MSTNAPIADIAAETPSFPNSSPDTSILVITAATRIAGLFATLKAQLAEARIAHHHEVLSDIPNNCGNLGFKVDHFRRLASRFAGWQRLVLIDAWDYLFYGSRDDLIARIPMTGVLLGAERNCWPDGYAAPAFPDTGTAHRYVNGGGTAGTPRSILAWLDAIEQHGRYEPLMIDQQWLNWRRTELDPLVSADATAGSVPKEYFEGGKVGEIHSSDDAAWGALDSHTRLFYSMIHESNELQCWRGRPVNTVSGTTPLFVHFNAKTNPASFLLLQSMSQQQDYLSESAVPNEIKERATHAHA